MVNIISNPDSDRQEHNTYGDTSNNPSPTNTGSPRNETGFASESESESEPDRCPDSDIQSIVQGQTIQPLPLGDIVIQVYNGWEPEKRLVIILVCLAFLHLVCFTDLVAFLKLFMVVLFSCSLFLLLLVYYARRHLEIRVPT